MSKPEEPIHCIYCGFELNHNSDFSGKPHKYCGHSENEMKKDSQTQIIKCDVEYGNFYRRLIHSTKSKNLTIKEFAIAVKKELKKGKLPVHLNPLLMIVIREKKQIPIITRGRK